MSTYKIINGNCIEKLKKIEANSIDLIFADPPYWMRVSGALKRVEGTDYDGCADEWDNQFASLDDYSEFTYNWLKECYRVLSPNGSIWVIGGMQCIYTIGNAMQEIGYWLINDIIWYKTNPTPNNSVKKPNVIPRSGLDYTIYAAIIVSIGFAGFALTKYLKYNKMVKQSKIK